MRIVSVGRLALIAVLLSAACSEGRGKLPTEEGTGPQLAAGGKDGPTTNMTWEGCQLYPELCGNGGGEDDPPGPNPYVGIIHEGYPDYDLRQSNLPDPNPGAAGLWLGFNDFACYTRVQNPPQADVDQDGLTDDCEFKLAKAFAPMINSGSSEPCLAGEPYWSAKYFDNVEPIHTGDFVRIAYMPGYYEDCGTAFAHRGDSEFISLTIGYNQSTHHWQLYNGFLSAHTCVDTSLQDCTYQALGAAQTWADGGTFQFPGNKSLTFPRVYVSIRKHANYRSESECDNGGALWGLLEECSNRDVGRFKVWESHNIGNVRHPLINCTPSQQTGADTRNTECFWSNVTFDGWNRGTDEVPGYVYFLHSYAFGCKWLAPGTGYCSQYGM